MVQLAMDIISEARMLVGDLELIDKVFSEGLGFKVKRLKTFNRYTMDSHAEILVYSDFDMFRLPSIGVHLTTSTEKIAKVANILKEAKEKQNFIYHEKIGDGILSTLDWASKDGSSLRLESFEDSYWTN